MSLFSNNLLKPLSLILVWCYLLILLPLNLIGHFIDNNLLVVISKPLLMPWLLMIFVFGTQVINKGIKTGVILALLFSWVGDMALMYNDSFPSLFMVGLGSFLVAHISYIVVFVFSADKMNRRRLTAKIMFPVFVIYCFGLLYFLWPFLGELKIPVAIYGTVLMLLGVTSVIRQVKYGYTIVWIGALLFITSDSILAINKFHEPIWFGRVWTMLTYGLAQLFIVLGIIVKINSPIENTSN